MSLNTIPIAIFKQYLLIHLPFTVVVQNAVISVPVNYVTLSIYETCWLKKNLKILKNRGK